MEHTPTHTAMPADALKRHKAFWNHEPMDRPSWGVSIGFFADEAYPHVMAKMKTGPIEPEDIHIEDLLIDLDKRREDLRGVGDFPFTCAAISNIPWMEAIAGCPIMASPSSFWAEPCLNDFENWSWDRSALESPWTKKLLELMRALAEYSGGRYQLSLAHMRGPSDILAAMRGAAQFAMDFMDTPDLVAPALQHCARIWREIAQAQLDQIPPSTDGYISLEWGLRAWAPDKLLWLQEDAMAFLSPRLYREYVLPLDRELSAAFPCVGFHLHGTSLWGIDELVQLPGINILELNLEPPPCDEEATFAGWKKIQEHKPLVIWRVYGDDFPSWLARVFREFQAKGISIQVCTHNIDEARIVQNEFRKYEGR